MSTPEAETLWLVGGVIVLLGLVTLVSVYVKRRRDLALDPAAVAQFHRRVTVWWVLCLLLATAFVLGRYWTVGLFGLMSLRALQEYITLTPTRRGDHRALFWVFFVFTPAQYIAVALDRYELYSILIPVGAFLFLAIRIAMAGDYKNYLERVAKIQVGLMICVYCLSFAPALLTRRLPPQPKPPPEQATALAQPSALGSSDREQPLPGEPTPTVTRTAPTVIWPEVHEERARLLFFFVLVVQLADVLQYAWGRLLGRRPIAPEVSPSRTWEGFFGGVASATVMAALLSWAVPFPVWQTATLAAATTAVGLAGGLVTSAVKRDRGVEDYGTLITGHGGILDRIDSLCFAAPVFFFLAQGAFPALGS